MKPEHGTQADSCDCDNVADFFCKLITVLQAHESELGDIEFSIDGDRHSVDLYLGSKTFNCQIVISN